MCRLSTWPLLSKWHANFKWECCILTDSLRSKCLADKRSMCHDIMATPPSGHDYCYQVLDWPDSSAGEFCPSIKGSGLDCQSSILRNWLRPHFSTQLPNAALTGHWGSTTGSGSLKREMKQTCAIYAKKKSAKENLLGCEGFPAWL